ncbi:MAG: hypothetical protein ACYDEA_13100 [Candidatus Dormibacteria bacterium]
MQLPAELAGGIAGLGGGAVLAQVPVEEVQAAARFVRRDLNR